MTMATTRTMASTAVIDGLVLIEGVIKGDEIHSEVDFRQIAALLTNGQIVILKRVFPSAALLDYRRAAVRWRDSTAPYPNGQSPSSTPAINYHRADTGAIRSAIPHIFQQYGFNSPQLLPDDVGRPTRWIGQSMLALQNSVAGSTFDISLSGMRSKLLHYPSGGGFLTEHEHPLEPQRVGLILSLSRLDADFNSGGTVFRTPFGRVDTGPHHDIGDIILFRYDLPHEVSPMDQGKKIDWNSEGGKWSFVLELRETFSRSQAK
jgi:hypothetical protein